MSPRQRVVFVQLQIASVGLLIFGFGFFWKENLLMLFGGVIFAYGLIRLLFLRRFLSDEKPDPDDAALDLSAYLPDEDERKAEKEADWPSEIERKLTARYAKKYPSLMAEASSLAEKKPENSKKKDESEAENETENETDRSAF